MTQNRAPQLARWVTIAAAVAALLSCDVFTAPPPENASPIEPLSHYGRWWVMVEQCAGHTRLMSDIDWYETPGPFLSSGVLVDGLFQDGAQRIVLARQVLKDGPTVRHEMLHAILRGRVDGLDHPAEYFLRRCDGVVTCPQQCVETAGPVDVPTHPLTGASVLEVTIETDSVVVRREHADFVYLPVTVRARNPLSTPVNIEVPSSFGFRYSFSLGVTPPAGVVGLWNQSANPDDPRAGYFEANETKQWVFDLYLPKTGPGLGYWSISGGFTTNRPNVATTVRLVP